MPVSVSDVRLGPAYSVALLPGRFHSVHFPISPSYRACQCTHCRAEWQDRVLPPMKTSRFRSDRMELALGWPWCDRHAVPVQIHAASAVPCEPCLRHAPRNSKEPPRTLTREHANCAAQSVTTEAGTTCCLSPARVVLNVILCGIFQNRLCTTSICIPDGLQPYSPLLIPHNISHVTDLTIADEKHFTCQCPTRCALTQNTAKRLSSHAIHQTLYRETPPTRLWDLPICTIRAAISHLTWQRSPK